jgi:transposase
MEVHGKLKARRNRSHKDVPDLTTIRRVVRGVTHLAGVKEKRGRKRKLGPLTIRRIEKARKDLIKKAAGEHEVHMDQIMSKARVRNVDASTVSRALHQLGVQWRSPREKPARSKEEMQERVSICGKWKYLPEDYFTDRLDLIMDNKGDRFLVRQSFSHIKFSSKNDNIFNFSRFPDRIFHQIS